MMDSGEDHRLRHQPLPYQQVVRCGLLSQPSVQPYSELKVEMSDVSPFLLKIYTVTAASFLINLIITGTVMTMLFWYEATYDVRGPNEFIRCHRGESETSGLTSFKIEEKEGQVKGSLTCSKLTSSMIKQSVLGDCDKDSDDELRVHPKGEHCFKMPDSSDYNRNQKSAGYNLLDQWEVGLNRSSVTLDKDGRFTVSYSGTYIIQSSLAFVCNSKNRPATSETSYWQEIQVNDTTYLRDAQWIRPTLLPTDPSYCYRSFIYGLLKLNANDSFRVKAGPSVLLRCKREMSYVAVYRP